MAEKKPKRRWKRWVLAGLLLVGGGFYISEPVFWTRYFSILAAGIFSPPLDWYDPVETVKGAAPPVELPRSNPEAEAIAPDAVARAIAYAGEQKSHALIIARHGRIVSETYWNDTTKDSYLSSHSFQKTLLAMMVGVAIGEGKIKSVDEPAATYLSEWANDARNQITVGALLEMAGGLEPPPYQYHPWSVTIRTFLGTDIVTPHMGIQAVEAPRTNFIHYNPYSQLLGILLERATGERIAAYWSTRLFQPLGLGDARVWLDRPGGMAHTDCCFISRTIDWIKIGQLMLNEGVYEGKQILPPGWVRAMTTPSPANPNYGYQIWLGSPYHEIRKYDRRREEFPNRASEPYLAEDLYFFDGYGNMRMYIVPSQSLVILRTGKLSDTFDDSMLPNTILRGLQSSTALLNPGPTP
jgi:CubicO group peptidase (beta-lactamase class C family)